MPHPLVTFQRLHNEWVWKVGVALGQILGARMLSVMYTDKGHSERGQTKSKTPSNPATLRTSQSVLIRGVASFQG